MSSSALVPASAQTLVQNITGRSTSSSLSTSTSAVSPARNSIPQQTSGATSTATISTPKQLRQQGWIHPRMDEVISRRNKTNFDSTNMKTVLGSAILVFSTFFTQNTLQHILPAPWLHSVQPYSQYVLWVLRAVFAACIAFAITPLLRSPDACEDIPLDPSQRQLLGLPPMSRPATPQEREQYVTPPRFSRSNTPRSSTSSVRAEVSGSPLSGRGTPLDTSTFPASGSGSPFSLQQYGSQSPIGLGGLKAGDERRRLSYPSNRSSPLSLSEFDNIGSAGTPTKGGNRASVGLNNKWLYEKGKGSPKPLYASRGPSFI